VAVAFAGDVSAFFADAPSVVVFGIYTTPAWFNEPGERVLGDMQISDQYSIEFPASALPGLTSGAAVQVDGSPFQVREVLPQDDGAIAIAMLEK
jgi:hypothetical protein